MRFQEEKTLALRKEGLGVVLDSELPHLIGIDDDILSTGIMLYHLKQGATSIGTKHAASPQDIGTNFSCGHGKAETLVLTDPVLEWISQNCRSQIAIRIAG